MLTAYRPGSLGGRREKGEYFTLDVVTNSQEEKCGLKYVMHSPAKVVECCGENLETSTVFVHSIK